MCPCKQLLSDVNSPQNGVIQDLGSVWNCHGQQSHDAGYDVLLPGNVEVVEISGQHRPARQRRLVARIEPKTSLQIRSRM